MERKSNSIYNRNNLAEQYTHRGPLIKLQLSIDKVARAQTQVPQWKFRKVIRVRVQKQWGATTDSSPGTELRQNAMLGEFVSARNACLKRSTGAKKLHGRISLLHLIRVDFFFLRPVSNKSFRLSLSRESCTRAEWSLSRRLRQHAATPYKALRRGANEANTR